LRRVLGWTGRSYRGALGEVSEAEEDTIVVFARRSPLEAAPQMPLRNGCTPRHDAIAGASAIGRQCLSHSMLCTLPNVNVLAAF
jgi:hypothetical protein